MAFREGHVEADGFRIRYMEAGDGPPLVHLHGAGGLRVTPAHELLSERFRVIAFEMPGFGRSPENTRTRTMAELARTMAEAATQRGLASFNLMGTSFGGIAALWLAVQAPACVRGLVLAAPAAIRPEPFNPPPPPSEQTRKL
ncbi:MAG TPA: alpha/beta fold hydrolase, partial [Vicinamibacteria bacterium]|nr:alpha/beta fold hydrolase [Vicinamibacteria bacterium]